MPMAVVCVMRSTSVVCSPIGLSKPARAIVTAPTRSTQHRRWRGSAGRRRTPRGCAWSSSSPPFRRAVSGSYAAGVRSRSSVTGGGSASSLTTTGSSVNGRRVSMCRSSLWTTDAVPRDETCYALSASCNRARLDRNRRETCTWLVPTFAAISLWCQPLVEAELDDTSLTLRKVRHCAVSKRRVQESTRAVRLRSRASARRRAPGRRRHRHLPRRGR